VSPTGSVSSTWGDVLPYAARQEYEELEERAGAALDVPLPASRDQARKLTTAVIDRRVEIVLDEEPFPDGGWVQRAVTPDIASTRARDARTRAFSTSHKLETAGRRGVERGRGLPVLDPVDHLLHRVGRRDAARAGGAAVCDSGREE
jgi:hypothetical protein